MLTIAEKERLARRLLGAVAQIVQPPPDKMEQLTFAVAKILNVEVQDVEDGAKLNFLMQQTSSTAQAALNVQCMAPRARSGTGARDPRRAAERGGSEAKERLRPPPSRLMASTARIGAARLEQIGQLYREGLNGVQIAERLGISPNSVTAGLRKLGLSIEDERDVAILRMVDDGQTLAAIGRHLGITRQAVLYRLRRLGVAPGALPSDPLERVYRRCMSGEAGWLDGIEERSRDDLRRQMIEELEHEESRKRRRGESTTALKHAIAMWRREESEGPRSVEAKQRPWREAS